MQPVRADHAIELAPAAIRELHLGVLLGLRDRLDGVAENELDVAERVLQDLAEVAANDLDITADTMAEVIAAHAIDDVAILIDEHGALHIGVGGDNRVMNAQRPEHLQRCAAHVDLVSAYNKGRSPLHNGRLKTVAP